MHTPSFTPLLQTPLPSDITRYTILTELASDMRWCLDNTLNEVWETLDKELWDQTHNPWLILQTVGPAKVDYVLGTEWLRNKINIIADKRRQLAHAPGWFQETHGDKGLDGVAYFSMEFMLGENLPIYSGGLGNVAGDQLKAAGDIGLPVLAVGLLFRQGYFRQVIDEHGIQQSLYPAIDTKYIPVIPLRDAHGEWVRFYIDIADEQVWINVWQVTVGRSKLLLLDSNDMANTPVSRDITSRLYGGDRETRLKQEIVLGIGGWRLLETLGINPMVCHLNEGHAAFAVLERAYHYMLKTCNSFDVALEVTRVGNLFTTHTAVPAGFDLFEPGLIKKYLGNYATEKLTISIEKLLSLGRKDPDDTIEGFNMANLAIRGGGAINGVSELHEKVSQRIFEPVFKRWPEKEIPIGHVTNGIHVPTWSSSVSTNLWESYCGNEIWLGRTKEYTGINTVDNTTLWDARNTGRKCLVDYIQKRVPGIADNFLDPGILTIGFARRFATYKRGDLLLHDKKRLLQILNNTQRPVQLILAGKAHPADEIGQAIIKQWIDFIDQSPVKPRVLFISDYDMLLAKYLVQGVDVWLNNPRRPWEASGTSGMKILANGGINLSILDGWWAEAYTPEVGWAIGDGKEHDDLDGIEAENLYELLEQKVTPLFYARNNENIPVQWLDLVRQSMSILTPTFSADRTVKEYTEKYYLRAANLLSERIKDNGAKGIAIVKWQEILRTGWKDILFKTVMAETIGSEHFFKVEVTLNKISSHHVRVQLYANGIEDVKPEIIDMQVTEESGIEDTVLFRAHIPNQRPSSDYTPRIIPHLDGVNIPLEAPYILWQK